MDPVFPDAKKADISQDYEFGVEIGKGTFSQVYVATSKNDPQQKVAVKHVKKGEASIGVEWAQQVKLLRDEVATLTRVRACPYVVKLLEIYENEEAINFVMELVTGGELFDKLLERGFFSEAETVQIVYALASGLAYCHERGVVHRDVKPENILCGSPEFTDLTNVKLIDFGLAVCLADGDFATDMAGTPTYTCPEIVLGEPYDFAADMWSLGVTTYTLLAGYVPFDDEAEVPLSQQITSGHYEFHSQEWSHISDTAKNFVSELIKVDPATRMTASEALQHAFLKDFVQQQLAKAKEQEAIRAQAEKTRLEKELPPLISPRSKQEIERKRQQSRVKTPAALEEARRKLEQEGGLRKRLASIDGKKEPDIPVSSSTPESPQSPQSPRSPRSPRGPEEDRRRRISNRMKQSREASKKKDEEDRQRRRRISVDRRGDSHPLEIVPHLTDLPNQSVSSAIASSKKLISREAEVVRAREIMKAPLIIDWRPEEEKLAFEKERERVEKLLSELEKTAAPTIKQGSSSVAFNFPTGDKYSGDVKDGQLLGVGTLTFSNGNSYTGEWKHSMREGRGLFTWKNGDTYDGEWRANLHSGVGIFKWHIGSTYRGQYLAGLKHGYGVYSLHQGGVYRGNFAKDRFNGYGVFTFPNGNRYEGYWRDDLKHGKGTFTSAKGEVYSGDWENDQRTGKGTWNDTKTGARYNGDFKNGRYNGKEGIYLTGGLDLYIGDWVEDKKHGKGTYVFSDSSSYRGDYMLNSRTGNGIYEWASGITYEGGWHEGLRHGKGVCTDISGMKFNEIWEKGNLVERKLITTQ